MANQDFPSVNDVASSWADISISFTPLGASILETADIKSIKFSDKVEVGEQRGTGGKLRARTGGQSSCDGSVVMYRSGFRKLVKALKAQAPTQGNQKKIGKVAFDVTVQHTPEGDSAIYNVKLLGCRLLGRSWDLKEGVDADTVELALNPIEIEEDDEGDAIVLV